MLKRFYIFAFLALIACAGCQWHLSPHDDTNSAQDFTIERYDRIERLFLTTGDFAALQELKTLYPTETRTLIEDVLQLGQVNDEDINSRFLFFFQDSTLQAIIRDVELEFADMSDITTGLLRAFENLQHLLPGIRIPRIYAQIGSLDQSIIVGDGVLGISLDKYLGEDYPLYVHFDYSEHQRKMMTRSAIIPDCIGFYLLSLYPSADKSVVQWTVNQCIGRKFFDNPEILRFDSIAKSIDGFNLESRL